MADCIGSCELALRIMVAGRAAAPLGPHRHGPSLIGPGLSGQLQPMRDSPSASAAGFEPGRVLFEHEITLRIRYSETDQMGTFYNSRPLEWFECGRTELLRALGMSYAQMEARGVFLPLVEAHVEYLGRARYDDLLRMRTAVSFAGRARVRLHNHIVLADSGRDVVRGYTVHAFTDATGKPIRPPAWFLALLAKAAPTAPASPVRTSRGSDTSSPK
jgi:acyl-CoA thioester hydrolase